MLGAGRCGGMRCEGGGVAESRVKGRAGRRVKRAGKDVELHCQRRVPRAGLPHVSHAALAQKKSTPPAAFARGTFSGMPAGVFERVFYDGHDWQLAAAYD